MGRPTEHRTHRMSCQRAAIELLEWGGRLKHPGRSLLNIALQEEARLGTTFVIRSFGRRGIPRYYLTEQAIEQYLPGLLEPKIIKRSRQVAVGLSKLREDIEDKIEGVRAVLGREIAKVSQGSLDVVRKLETIAENASRNNRLRGG